MASSDDDSPPQHQEKRSKKNNDPVGSSKPSGCIKATCSRDAGGTHGRGRAAHASGVQAPVAPPSANPPPRVGAQQWEFVPSIGVIPTIDEAKEALKQAGRTIASDVCPRTPPRGPTHFGESHLVPF